MKVRRIVTAALALALGMSLGAPALAADAADARLTKVTQAVKATLSISDEYTEFYGEPSETPLGTKWGLEWGGEDKGISVIAADDGKVLSMNTWESSDQRENGFGPSFPAMTRAQAQEKAQAFLEKVLTSGERAVFDEDDSTAVLSAESYSFRGSIFLNGLPSPLGFYARVRLSDGAVINFWRDDPSEYVGTVPAAGSKTSQAQAAALLKGTLALRLEYVLDEGGEKAVLRYLPENGHEFYVDDAAGKLVDLTELREKLAKSYTGGAGGSNMTYATAESAAMDRGGLTEAELAGVAKLEGVKTQEELDKAVRAWKELGLSAYQLSGATWSVDRETGDVSARLSYGRNTEAGIYRRAVTVDAKTGALLSVSGSNPATDAQPKLTADAAQAKGEAFLKALWGGQFSKTELYDSTAAEKGSAAHSFTYAQKVNGYFFPANAITVRVDAADGTILGLFRTFDDEVSFDSAEGLISAEAALDAWAASFPVPLAYLEVPVELDLSWPEAKPLLDAGYSYYNALKLGYGLGEQDAWYTGVDAKTGALVKAGGSEGRGLSYDDLAGHWSEAIFNQLAEYDVGWQGGRADPDGALTQMAYVALLASADGYRFDPAEDKADDLYSYAYSRGILAKGEREDGKVLTRAECVRLLLDSVGYGSVAKLPGIFRCDFADAAAIPAEDLGYAALAQGLGIVGGDAQGNFAPGRSCTRGEAAAMLWQYMKR
ncbi:hypothetical protein CE91St43_00500 [Oscillospiraceae bacterium]|nr:hypothetical protein CE91St43_00500 [Oscillospiraceae bacterium]